MPRQKQTKKVLVITNSRRQPHNRELSKEMRSQQTRLRNRVSRVIQSAPMIRPDMVKKLALSIAAPYDNLPTRWADQYSSRPTSVAPLNAQRSVDFAYLYPSAAPLAPTAAAKAEWPDNGEFVAALSRSLVHALVYLQPNPTGAYWKYQVKFNGSYSFSAQGEPFSDEYRFRIPPNANADLVLQDVMPAYLEAISAYVPGGEPRQFCANHLGRNCFWVDGWQNTAAVVPDVSVPNTTINVAGICRNNAGAPIANSGLGITVALHRLFCGSWIEEDARELKSFVATGFVNETFTILRPGYYAFTATAMDKLLTVTDCWAGIKISVEGMGPNMVHVPSIELFDHKDELTSGVIVASNVVLTSASAMLVENGSCGMVQMEAGASWAEMFEKDALSRVRTLNGFYGGTFKKGAAGFLKPRAATDFIPQKVFCHDRRGNATGVVYPLISPSGPIVLCAKVAVSATPTDGTPALAALAILSTAQHLEFTTTSMWREIRVSPFTPDETEQALRIVARMPQFDENPLHLSDIMNFVTGALRGVGRIAPSVARAVATFAPQYAGPAESAARFIARAAEMV